MKLNTPFLKKITFLLLSLFFILSCDKDDIPQKQTTGVNTGIEAINNETSRLDKVLTSESITTNFSITVIDEDNNSISNATVKIANKESHTNNNGFTLIENITVNKDFQAINVNANGYTPSIKTITPSTNGVSNVTVTLLKPTFIKIFSAAEGGVVSNDNISIEFPKDAIADQNGNLYEGEVKTTVTYYNPNSETFVQSMPGTLVGLDDSNSLQSLISKGMIKVDLTDNSGNELEIFEGKEATIKLPAGNNDPTTIPFWHLNEEKGLWVQTGTATKNGNQYIASVKHFSTYNLDVPGETIDLTVVLKDTNNNLLANQKAILKATNSNGSYEIEVETDNKGEFTVIKAPKGANYNLNIITDCETITLPVGIINQTTQKEFLVSFNNARYLTLNGVLNKCNNEIWANKVFTIELENGNQQDLVTAYADTEGKYSITKVLCNYDTTTTYKGKIRVINGVNDIIKENDFIFNVNNLIKNIIVCNGAVEIVNERIYEGDYEINSDQDLEEFIAGNYTKITGTLEIENITATDLTGLENLTIVEDYLYIRYNNNLINLKGLENLIKVNTFLVITSNSSLVNLQGIEKLTDTDILIDSNTNLTSLKGIENIKITDEYAKEFNFTIANSDLLTDITALSHLEEFQTLIIANHAILQNLSGLESLKKLSSLVISNNKLLNNLNGLENLSELGTIEITDNVSLINFCSLNTQMISNIDDTETIVTDPISNITYTISDFEILENNYNPTKQDLLNGNCNQ
ncbi:hypothetical protein H3Z83_01785 [Tenacibaculum sp. S7007]|uniref:Uncharacterized protein n=1 Tax=Tenacibaculum pelagium TaxID=2759527 RepID=A0A839ALI7_9FLAO|nr:carboxypeptidase-like regulatory domain-containing protein [Tenacibaculum pelagium]MBA6155258.1 hypothetical protein [Tenacibaculum pelagium]